MESESCQSDITSVDPTKGIVKYFAKCLIELAKHAESIQYKNNKIVNYDVSSQSKVDEGSGCELDITEHNIKAEIQIEGKIFEKINKLKKCIVELLTLCSQQNIIIDYDTTRPNITAYDTFDDAQRILVMNHLTLSIIAISESIYLSIKLLKTSKYMENGQHIRKSFSSIFKEIKSLPRRPDIIENMDSSFKSLTNKNEYTDSYNYLVEQLTILCKYIDKFNRVYHRKCGYNDMVTLEDTCIFSDESSSKITNIKLREKNNLNRQETEDTVFKTPESIQLINTDTRRYITVNPDERTENEKNPILQNLDNITAGESHIKNKEFIDINIESKKKRKHKSIVKTENILDKANNYKNVKSFHDNIEDNIIEKKTETNKKNKNEREFHVEKIINSVATNTNVSQLNGENTNPNIENDIAGNKSETKLKSKTKQLINKESNQNQDVEKLIAERELHVIEVINSVATNTNVNEIIGEKTNLSIENDKIENTTETKKKSKKRKFNKDTEMKNKDYPDQIESQQENDVQVHKKRKLKKLSKEERNLNMKSTSATNHPEIHDECYRQDLNTYLKKIVNADNEFMHYIEDNNSTDDAINELSNDLNNKKATAKRDPLPSEILSAIANGDIEIDYDDQDAEDFTKIITQNNLNENERYLYIQDLLETAKDKVVLSDNVKEKLRGLKILVDWEVPPAHEICAKLTSGPSEEEKIKLEALGVTTQKHFSRKESDIIRRNWKLFCEKHDLEDDPVPFLLLPTLNNNGVLDYSERKKFIQFLGQGLPNKALHSIYSRFKVIFTPQIKKGRFTPEEDQLILTYMSRLRREDISKKFSRLSPILNRSRDQIERRYRYLRHAAEQSTKKMSWDLELQATFLKHLLEETHSNDVEDLRYKNIDLNVFMVIGAMMHIPPSKLKLHWLCRLYTQLFATEPIVTDLIQLKLIKIFRKSKFDDWKTVDWQKIVAKFHGFTKRHLWSEIRNIEKRFVPKQYHQNLKACIEYLHTHYVPKLKLKPTFGKRIRPRLQYENGILTKYV